MKLSFSTNRWRETSMEEFFALAKEYRFAGVEIHSVKECPEEKRTALYHAAVSGNLSICCIDVCESIGAPDSSAAMAELSEALGAAVRLHAPYVRLRAGDEENAKENAEAFLSKAIPLARKSGIILLLETVGVYANTATLRETLNAFADDNLAALWQT